MIADIQRSEAKISPAMRIALPCDRCGAKPDVTARIFLSHRAEEYEKGSGYKEPSLRLCESCLHDALAVVLESS